MVWVVASFSVTGTGLGCSVPLSLAVSDSRLLDLTSSPPPPIGGAMVAVSVAETCLFLIHSQVCMCINIMTCDNVKKINKMNANVAKLGVMTIKN